MSGISFSPPIKKQDYWDKVKKQISRDLLLYVFALPGVEMATKI
jgi:hypothetical protein